MTWLSEKVARRLGIIALDWPPPTRVAAKPDPSQQPYQDPGRLQNGTDVPPRKSAGNNGNLLDRQPLAPLVPHDKSLECKQYGAYSDARLRGWLPCDKPQIKIATAEPRKETPRFVPHFEPAPANQTQFGRYAVRGMCAIFVLVMGWSFWRARSSNWQARADEAREWVVRPPPLPPPLSHAVGLAAVGAALEAAAPPPKPKKPSPWSTGYE